ncbi:MAG: hypothetical protein C4293_20660 [Nitrospiraceae bacterium]
MPLVNRSIRVFTCFPSILLVVTRAQPLEDIGILSINDAVGEPTEEVGPCAVEIERPLLRSVHENRLSTTKQDRT